MLHSLKRPPVKYPTCKIAAQRSIAGYFEAPKQGGREKAECIERDLNESKKQSDIKPTARVRKFSRFLGRKGSSG